MRKSVLAAVLAILLIPLNTYADDGFWISPAAPGYFFVTLDGRVPSDEDYLGLIVLFPDQSGWEIFYGPKSSAGLANLSPLVSPSDLSAEWRFLDSNTAELYVFFCSQNCLFSTNELVRFQRIFGDDSNGDDNSNK